RRELRDLPEDEQVFGRQRLRPVRADDETCCPRPRDAGAPGNRRADPLHLSGLHELARPASRHLPRSIDEPPGARDPAPRAAVRDHAAVGWTVSATVAAFGGLDVVVNNAGIGSFVLVAEMTAAQWAEVIDTNVTGVFNVCNAALPSLRQRGGGYIINISSLAGKNPFVGAGAYC